MQNPYLTLHDVARILNISYMTVYRWSRVGKLKSFLVGRQLRVSPEDLQDFVARGEKINLNFISHALSRFIGSGMMDYSYMESRHFPVDLSLGVNPLGCSPRVTEYYQQKTIQFSSYSEVTSQKLRKKLAQIHGCAEDQILIGAGVSDLLHLAYVTLLNPYDKIVLPELTFPTIEFLVILTHAIPLYVGHDATFDLIQTVFESMLQQRPKLVALCNPNNPTGRQLDFAFIESVIRIHSEVIFLIDEANINFGGTSLLGLIKKYSNLIVLRSFSKGFGLAGLRVGYAVGQRDLIYAMSRRQVPFSVNVFAQKLAEVALDDLGFLEKTREYVQGERKYLEKELRRLGYSFIPSDANFLLVQVKPKFESSDEFIKVMNKLGANVVNGKDFRGLGEQYVRLSPRKRDHNEKFVSILERIVR